MEPVLMIFRAGGSSLGSPCQWGLVPQFVRKA